MQLKKKRAACMVCFAAEDLCANKPSGSDGQFLRCVRECG